MLEVHAVYAGQKGERNKDGADDGEQLNDVVHAETNLRQVQILQAIEEIPGGVCQFNHANRVVEKIPQKNRRSGCYKGVLTASEAVDGFAHGARQFSQRDDGNAQVVDFALGSIGRAGHDLYFQIGELFFQLVQDDKVVVDDGIDERIRQVVGGAAAHPAAGHLQPAPDRRKQVAVLFLKGQQAVAGKKNSDLLGIDIHGFPVEIERAHYHKQRLVILLKFGTLVDVEHIFNGQRVHLIAHAQLLNELNIVQSAHIIP